MVITSNRTSQQIFELSGDFGLSRHNLIKLANGGITGVFSAGQAAWQVARPYKDSYTKFGK